MIKMHIAFDTPETFIQRIQAFLTRFPYIHCRLIIEEYVEDSSLITITEMCHENTTLEAFVDTPLSALEFPSNCNKVVFTKSFEQGEHNEIYIASITRFITLVQDMKLRWSNWLSIPYLLTGEFPTLTCCSYIGWLVFLDVSLNTPKKLFEYLKNCSDWV